MKGFMKGLYERPFKNFRLYERVEYQTEFVKLGDLYWVYHNNLMCWCAKSEPFWRKFTCGKPFGVLTPGLISWIPILESSITFHAISFPKETETSSRDLLGSGEDSIARSSRVKRFKSSRFFPHMRIDRMETFVLSSPVLVDLEVLSTEQEDLQPMHLDYH